MPPRITIVGGGSYQWVFEAMFLDPLAGRVDYERIGAMTDAMLAPPGPGSQFA